MTDAEEIERMGEITDPYAALQLVLDNEGHFGFDPYYRAIRDAVLATVERVVANRPTPTGRRTAVAERPVE